MKASDITFGVLVGTWFSENISDHFMYHCERPRFPTIYSVRCRCDFNRALAVVLDVELEARIFNEPVQMSKSPDWQPIIAADPDFFVKFKNGLLECHEQRSLNPIYKPDRVETKNEYGPQTQ